MSVAGKKKHEWVAQTFCDFGETGRRTVLTNHFSINAARTRWPAIVKIYTKEGWTCWQEDRAGNVLRREPEPYL